MTEKSREMRLLIELLTESFQSKAWHGPNLRGSVRGLNGRQASRRPGARRHNIWEIVVHAAYWKYAVWRRLTGQRRGSFPLKGSNWFVRPASGPGDDWKQDVALLDHTHRVLRDAIAGLPDRNLRRKSRGSKVSNFELIAGIAAHDLYHAGQIQLLKRLMRG